MEIVEQYSECKGARPIGIGGLETYRGDNVWTIYEAAGETVRKIHLGGHPAAERTTISKRRI